jgi:hypothetical protein
MWLLSIFNAGLLALPVAITTGLYLAVEWQLILHGPPSGSDITSDTGGTHSTDGSITTSTYCQKEYGITPSPGRYTCELFTVCGVGRLKWVLLAYFGIGKTTSAVVDHPMETKSLVLSLTFSSENTTLTSNRALYWLIFFPEKRR